MLLKFQLLTVWSKLKYLQVLPRCLSKIFEDVQIQKQINHIWVFGTTSPAALATTVGVLTEVPVMLFLVKIANGTKGWFKNG